MVAGAFALMAGTPARCAWEIYLEGAALARCEPIAIHDAITGWKGSYGTGRRAYAFGRVEWGARYGDWGLGLVWRQDYDLRFSPDAAGLYGAVRNDQSLVPGKVYAVNLEANILQARGLRLSRRWGAQDGLRLEGGLTLLQGISMTDGHITGTALATGPKAYVYSAQVEEAYTKDELFERARTPVSSAMGLTPDLRLDWSPAPSWDLRAEVRDGLGRIWWRHLPRTTAQADSARAHEEGGDFRRWDPLVSGLESFHATYRQELPCRGMVEVRFAPGTWTVAAGADAQFGDWLPRLGAGRAWGTWTLLGWWGLRDKALGLEVRRGPWGLRASLDAAWERAKTASLAFSGRW